jgi:hypothetical protein
MNIAIVGGTFDEYGGSESHFVNQIATQALKWIGYGVGKVNCINGGDIADLYSSAEQGLFHDYQAVLWMPNIDNKHPKILPNIKKSNPALILIQSKRVIEKEYSDLDIIKRLLASHSALGLKITKADDEYQFTILDPLGNAWAENTSLDVAVEALMARVVSIGTMSRMRTQMVGPREDFELEDDFLDAVRHLGEEFTEYVTAINPDRFLGNASTRCCHGFPSKRSDHDTVYMSKRNVDKTIISNEQFVEVAFNQTNTGVDYFGDQKPSVDTPIQMKLYAAYPNVNYMVHGHVYVKDAPYTEENVPCGFLEEVGEIVRLVPDSASTNFVINLKGHGCLIMADNVEYLKTHEFITRPCLETQ